MFFVKIARILIANDGRVAQRNFLTHQTQAFEPTAPILAWGRGLFTVASLRVSLGETCHCRHDFRGCPGRLSGVAVFLNPDGRDRSGGSGHSNCYAEMPRQRSGGRWMTVD